jgi:hypothetical protein
VELSDKVKIVLEQTEQLAKELAASINGDAFPGSAKARLLQLADDAANLHTGMGSRLACEKEADPKVAVVSIDRLVGILS